MSLNLFPEKVIASPYSLFVDGGVILKNPSKLGGTVAWVLVKDDTEVMNFSSTIMPEYVGLPAITNNITELLAAVMAMEAMEMEFDGVLWTDSMVTYLRLLHSNAKMNGVPRPIIDRMVTQKARLKKISYSHLKGHPSKEELTAGVTAKDVPVSKWNVLCDALCNARSEEFLGKS